MPSSTNNPFVSVVIPIYNCEKFLSQALDSIIAQTYSNFEIVVVNDGSTDRSQKILESYQRHESRLRVFSQKNTGIVGALNSGIAASRGELIARMDGDDISYPQRLAKQISFLNANPMVVAVGSDVYFTDPEGRRLIRHLPKTNHREIVDQLLDGNGGAIIHPSLVVRREALVHIGGYREEYQWIEDLDLYIRLAEVGELANIPEPLLDYRQHMKSVNRTRGNREEQRQSIVNPHRTRYGLTPLEERESKSWGPDTPFKSDWRRHWAYEAARGGNWRTAKINAFKAFCLNPIKRDNLKCLKYILYNCK